MTLHPAYAVPVTVLVDATCIKGRRAVGLLVLPTSAMGYSH